MHLRIALVCLVFTAGAYAQRAANVKSPDRRVQAAVSTLPDGRLAYIAKVGNHDVLTPSPIGVIVDGVDLGLGVELDKATPVSSRIEFPWRGNHRKVSLEAGTLRVPIKHKSGVIWTLEMHCFDGGVAYRCVIPGTGDRKVTGEAAAWNFLEGTHAWCNPDTNNYEGVHERFALNVIPADKFKRGIGMPTTLELPHGGYALLTEAEIMRYSGMTLEPTGKWQLQSSFRDDPKGWAMSGVIRTPWRVLLVANDLNALVNNDIVPALCPPPNPDLFPNDLETDWLKPGRCLWQWWAYDDPGTHWSRQKWFVDKAAELNCRYYLVDEGWEHTRQEWASEGKDVWARLKELCDYAAGKKVGIWVWRGWDPRPQRQWPGLETQEKREDFFRRCAEAGVKGAKIDFMDSESHDRLEFYQACLRTAAKHKIMLDFHGANKPAGESRTWPNEMTREGIRGMEYNKWSDLPPVHYATLPFTRLVVGPGDFTPTTFQQKFLKGTTVALQLASAVVFTSPVLCWADKPDVYLESPALELIRRMPPVWDETIVLPGSKIGDLAIFARRSGEEWYVGVINGGKARDVEIKFAFLPAGDFKADFFGDVSGEPTKFDVQREQKVGQTTSRKVHLSDGGGFVAWIRK